MPDQILLHADARTVVSPADCQEFHALLTDPPYSPETHAKPVSCSRIRGATERDFGFAPLDTDLLEYLAACAAQVAGWAVMYSDLESAADLARACEGAGAERVRMIPWVRWSMPQLSADRPPQGAEMLVLLHGQDVGSRGGRKPRPKSWYGPGWLTHLAHGCMRGHDKHPTEKPLDQSLDLVHWFTTPGETVFDPCAGRGGLGVACALLGRGYVGCEIQAEHAVIGQERIRLARSKVLSTRDDDRVERWSASVQERILKAEGILADEQAKIGRWQLKHPGEPVPDRLTPSVQNIRCLDAMRRDLLMVTE